MEQLPDSFRAVIAREKGTAVRPSVENVQMADLPEGELLVRVEHSSLNYKDMLSAFGNRGVTKTFPHTPGIDAAGVVVESSNRSISEGTRVVVTGRDLGMNTWGGLAQFIRVPAGWVLPIPDGVESWEMMAFGTAGFTAVQSVLRVHTHRRNNVGTVLVTGATGAVGSIAVALLESLGYTVTAASTRSAQQKISDYLGAIGAKEIIDAGELHQPERPLERARWDAVVDCVGGAPLAAGLSALTHRGCATTCGMVAGTSLSSSVFPFILRGVTLYGIDSAECPIEQRKEVWNLITGEWRLSPERLEQICRTISLDEVPEELTRMRDGRSQGHTVVRI